MYFWAWQYILYTFVKLHSPSWFSATVKPFIGWTSMGRTRGGSWPGWEVLFSLTFISEKRQFTGLTKTLESSTKHPWEEHIDRWLHNHSRTEAGGAFFWSEERHINFNGHVSETLLIWQTHLRPCSGLDWKQCLLDKCRKGKNQDDG